MGDVQAMKIAVKRKSKKPSGYEVELKEDGHYYGKSEEGYLEAELPCRLSLTILPENSLGGPQEK
jgi:hypothetical protein